MSLSQQAREVITRRLPPEKIKQRPGGGGMTFDYVTPDTIIDILNEAFDHQWDMRILDSRKEDTTVIVRVELQVWGEEGNPVVKQQFGSCEITRGLGVGEAFKGAASDALKKTATLLGVALELYQDDDAPVPSVPRKTAATTAPRAPAKPSTPAARQMPPRPPAPVAPPRPASKSPTSPAPPAPPQQRDNPFDDDAPTTTAKVPVPRPAPLPAAARPAPASPVVRKADPFGGGTVGGISPTQLNALTNIASRKDLSQTDLIALANVVDEEGNPKAAFDELENAEAIQVIRAAQQ